jgi:hypothetical protein
MNWGNGLPIKLDSLMVRSLPIPSYKNNPSAKAMSMGDTINNRFEIVVIIQLPQ